MFNNNYTLEEYKKERDAAFDKYVDGSSDFQDLLTKFSLSLSKCDTIRDENGNRYVRHSQIQEFGSIIVEFFTSPSTDTHPVTGEELDNE